MSFTRREFLASSAALAAGLALFLSQALSAKSQQTTGTAIVAGRVTRTDTGAPIEKAGVRLTALNGVSVQTVLSTESGDFILSKVPPGEYRLFWNATGLANADATPSQPFGGGRLIKVLDGQRISNLQLTLSPMPVISGRVLDQSGKPVSDVRVSLANLRNRWDAPRLVNVSVQNDRTDADGKYRFGNLLPGDYYVLATAGPFVRANPNDTTVVPDKLLPYIPTYFPGTATASGARPVRVALGIDASDVTFSLVPCALIPVSGRVSNANGEPVPDTSLLLIPTDGGEVQRDLAAVVKSDANGRFLYRGIPPGTYVLQAFARDGFGSRAVGVPSFTEEVAGIDVMVRPLVSARGRVSFEGGPPPAKDGVLIGVVPTDFSSGPVGSISKMVKPADDWTFEISELASIGLVRVIFPPGWALKSVMLNNRDIVDLPSDFQTVNVNGLELVMTNRLSSIIGTVTDGIKPAASLILILPEDQKNSASATRTLNLGGAASDGTFKVTGILAGRYRVIAIEQPTTYDMEWLRGLHALATPVTVAENETKTIALKLVRR